MKNFSNYTDFDTKENLHFESKAVHGALGTEPLTGAVSMPIFQAATFRHPELGESTGFAYSRLENPPRHWSARWQFLRAESRDSHFPADRRQTWLSFPC